MKKNERQLGHCSHDKMTRREENEQCSEKPAFFRKKPVQWFFAVFCSFSRFFAVSPGFLQWYKLTLN